MGNWFENMGVNGGVNVGVWRSMKESDGCTTGLQFNHGYGRQQKLPIHGRHMASMF